ncbi:LAGLIDADG family homing endonuclease [Clostridium sp. Marseille-QA1073]
MLKKCLKCNKNFNADSKIRKFCSKSCANSFNTTKRKVHDNSLYTSGMNTFNAYVLGLIYSDGCLSFDEHSNRYRITITMNEYDLMECLNKFICPTKKLYKYKHPKGREFSYSVITTNEFDINFLKELGLTERKSKSIMLPVLPNNLMSHFVRGYFDGDGSVYVNKTKQIINQEVKYYKYINCNFTTGSIKFAEQLRNVLFNNDIENTLVADSRRSDAFYVKIYKKESIKKFYNYIYKDASLYIKRKHLKFAKMI